MVYTRLYSFIYFFILGSLLLMVMVIFVIAYFFRPLKISSLLSFISNMLLDTLSFILFIIYSSFLCFLAYRVFVIFGADVAVRYLEGSRMWASYASVRFRVHHPLSFLNGLVYSSVGNYYAYFVGVSLLFYLFGFIVLHDPFPYAKSTSSGLSYPEMLAAYKVGRLLVLPEVAPSLIGVGVDGALSSRASSMLAITWPYGLHTPETLQIFDLPLNDLLVIRRSIQDVHNPSVGGCHLEHYFVRPAMSQLDDIVDACTYFEGGSLVLEDFTTGMFLGIRIEELRELGRWLDHNNLIALRSVCPSLHPTYLSLGITASEGQLFVENHGLFLQFVEDGQVPSPELLLEMLTDAPKELTPDPFHFVNRYTKCNY